MGSPVDAVGLLLPLTPSPSLSPAPAQTPEELEAAAAKKAVKAAERAADMAGWNASEFTRVYALTIKPPKGLVGAAGFDADDIKAYDDEMSAARRARVKVEEQPDGSYTWTTKEGEAKSYTPGYVKWQRDKAASSTPRLVLVV